MSKVTFMELTEEKIRRYYSLLDTPGECYTWKGDVRLTPSKLVPVMFHEFGVLIDVAPIGFAVSHSLTEIPAKHHKNICGNDMCVRGEHIRLFSASRSGRRREHIHETADFDTRFDAIKELVTKFPVMHSRDILCLLRVKGVGIKNNTFFQILAEVRSSLNLPPHPVGRGRKVTFQETLSNGSITDTAATSV